MSDKISSPSKKVTSPDWFVRGVLTKLGDIFDRFTGRNWQPANNLATSELIERLKILMDAEAKEFGGKGKFVPHNITLKMQWDKFSTDAEQSLKKLEYELLTAAIDHINDCRYHTHAPLKLEIKTDYFTEGVKLSAGFDDFAEESEEETPVVAAPVPKLKNVVIESATEETVEPEKTVFIAAFSADNQPKNVQLVFTEKQRKSVGRTKENDLWLDDAGVSKIHAALVLDADGQLLVADTGSTNGTFVNEERIAYGKSRLINDGDKLKFGTVEVTLRRVAGENSEAEFGS